MNQRQPLQNISNLDRRRVDSSLQSLLLPNKNVLVDHSSFYASRLNKIRRECFDQWKFFAITKKNTAFFATPKKRRLDDEANFVDDLLRFSFFNSEPRRENISDIRTILRTPHSSKRVVTENGSIATNSTVSLEPELSTLRKFPDLDESDGANELPKVYTMRSTSACTTESINGPDKSPDCTTDHEANENCKDSSQSNERSTDFFHAQVYSSIKTSISTLHQILWKHKTNSNFPEYRKWQAIQDMSHTCTTRSDVVPFHTLPDVQLKLQDWKKRYTCRS